VKWYKQNHSLVFIGLGAAFLFVGLLLYMGYGETEIAAHILAIAFFFFVRYAVNINHIESLNREHPYWYLFFWLLVIVLVSGVVPEFLIKIMNGSI